VKYIEIIGAKQNNLKSIDLKIPIHSFTVVCGPSGSGKSSLVFETLFAQGQRHYTQTLSNYARQYIQELPKPLVEKINNIPPALALEQKNSIRSSRPTVATLTELSDLLQLLFVGHGMVFCPKHQEPLLAYSPVEGAKKIQEIFFKQRGMVSVPIDPLATGLSALKLKKLLLKDGFYRVWWQEDELAKESELKKESSYTKGLLNINSNINSKKTGDSKKERGFKNKGGSKKEKPPVIQDLNVVSIPPNKTIFLILDRLEFIDKERLTDSLRTAYKLSVQYNKTWQKGRALVSNLKNEHYILSEKPACLKCSYQFPFPLQTSLFNFNSSLGACSSCRGFGSHLVLDEKKVVPEPEKSLASGAIKPFTLPSTTAELRSLKRFCQSQNIDIHCAWSQLPKKQKEIIWKGSTEFMGVKGFFDYLESKKYKMHVRIFLTRYKSPFTCLDCNGSRFRKEVSYVFFKGKSLPELLSMDLHSLRDFFKSLNKEEVKKGGEVIRKILSLLEGFYDIGLSYLCADRPVNTLSSGEFQRLNLVHQLGMGLSRVLYVLDEPTLGLHSRDSLRLIEMLKKLSLKKNTVVVVEHDPDVIKKSSFVVEMGPESGVKGGEVVFVGPTKDFLKNAHSLTQSYLHKTPQKPHQKKNLKKSLMVLDPKAHKYFLEISGCNHHNLKNVCLRVPLNRLVTVTGVSGSGKSTLISQTLYPALARNFGKPVHGHPYKELKGVKYLKQVIWVDASPVEKAKRSLPVTYLKIFDVIRSLMAANGNAYGLSPVKPGVFSLNIEGGRCPLCKGLGYLEIEMVFMDPINIPCEECGGKRFRAEILERRWKGKNIHDILNMTVSNALEFFVSYPSIWKPLSILKKVGLDYLSLGQSLSTMSGGETQRLKLARALLSYSQKNVLYILDEPSIGLHFREVALLLKLLKDLVKKGASVLVIEHNMDIIRQSDYLIDIGPEAGPGGGEIIAYGAPHQVALSPKGYTSSCLRKYGL